MKDIERHHRRVSIFVGKHDRLPAPHEVSFAKKGLDPWGSPYLLRQLLDPKTFDVISSGPDRILNTYDDFGWTHRRAMERFLHHDRVERARQRVAELGDALDKFIEYHGYAPALDQLTSKDRDQPKRLFNEKALTDPWGERYQARRIGSKLARVISLGPDRLELTVDDVGTPWTAPSKQLAIHKGRVWFPQDLIVKFNTVDTAGGAARLRFAMHPKGGGVGLDMDRVGRRQGDLESCVRAILSKQKAGDLRSAETLTHITNELRSDMIALLFPGGKARIGEIEWMRLDP